MHAALTPEREGLRVVRGKEMDRADAPIGEREDHHLAVV
jgi:hypothetical protein